MKQEFCYSPDSVKWLLETHLKDVPNVPNDIASFLMRGNDDCPMRVDVFLTENPTYDAIPYVSYVFNPDTRKLEEEPQS